MLGGDYICDQTPSKDLGHSISNELPWTRNTLTNIAECSLLGVEHIPYDISWEGERLESLNMDPSRLHLSFSLTDLGVHPCCTSARSLSCEYDYVLSPPSELMNVCMILGTRKTLSHL